MFYHLTRRAVNQALAELLERTLSRGWRATVRVGLEDRVAHLDQHLWTYRDDAFLPHGTVADGFVSQQPVYLTAGEETPNDPDVLLLVHRASARDEELSRYQRLVILFDGGDGEAVEDARGLWRRAAGGGCAAQYWTEDQRGRWTKQHERA
jgi:DNA polymerase-3 subunit chi